VNELAELHRFNTWANRSLIAGLRKLSVEQLDERPEDRYNSIIGVMAHLAQVELSYLRLMRDEEREPVQPMPLDELEALLERTGAGLREIAETRPLDSTFRIPWFERDFTLAQGLRQVLTHSMNHRADVNHWLPRYGVESTDQDYIDMARAE
jgi:uncharacterized damage-inducible protein DinB